MGTEKHKALSTGHRKAFGVSHGKSHGKKADLHPQPPEDPEIYSKRIERLKMIPAPVLRKAWFSMAHLMLPTGAQVADMGCSDGAITHAMAVLHPRLRFVGIDQDSKLIAKAKKTYNLPNLEFRTADIAGNAGCKPESLDAIVNSFILHEIYSGSRYNDRQVAGTLEQQFGLLKQDGLMFVRDFALQNPGEYVLIELPDVPTRGKDVQTMTETDLLLWYADHARPKEDPGCCGFFLEELPARFPQTRLFRLPYKWAYEFIIRKDNRPLMQAELHKEYTFFTQREFRKTLRSFGARTLYSAPLWDEKIIEKRFKNRFRLYDDNGKPMGMPPTSFIAVAQKTGIRKSLSLEERRPSQKAQTNRLHIKAMRNDRTGKIVDIVSRDVDITEVIPYRVTEQGRLNIFVHEGLPRGIINAVPRHGKDLDGKKWSGHMVESLAVPTDVIATTEQGEAKETAKFARDYLGLKPAIGCKLEAGGSYYPAPDYIDDVIKSRYLRVAERDGAPTIEPKAVMEDIRGFTTTGRVREVDAQDVLDSIAVGFTPNSRLEIHILNLFGMLGMEAETWNESPLVLEESEPEVMFDGQDFTRLKSLGDTRFKDVKGNAGQLRTVQSTFVDEGWVDGGISGLASRDLEFVISDDNTLNKAVVLPMTKYNNDVLVGMEVEYLPVPQRQSGNGILMKAPSFNLPREITDIHQAKKYIADLFKIPPENVWRLGESYFCHAGITPQRVFPFAISAPGTADNPIGGPIQFAPMSYIWDIIGTILDWQHDENFISAVKKAHNFLSHENDMSLKWAAGREAFYKQRGHDVLNVSGAHEPTRKVEAPVAKGAATSHLLQDIPATPAKTTKATDNDPGDNKAKTGNSKKFHIK